MALNGKVALVTGASRGIGKGIALVLAKDGAKVYITGRHKGGARADGSLGDLELTAAEVASAGAAVGGSCIAIACDHSDDKATEDVISQLFEREGNIDILVNNAFQGQDSANKFGNFASSKFWEKPLEHYDMLNGVGLRSHYVVLALCSRQWVKRGRTALAANISSAAGAGYVFDVAYGIGKCGVDRLTADAAKELKPHGVAVVSIWPGAVATESKVSGVNKDLDKGMEDYFKDMESVEFSGRGIAALAKNPERAMAWSGRIALTPELAEEFGFEDVGGGTKWGTFLSTVREGMKHPPAHWRKPKAPKAKL